MNIYNETNGYSIMNFTRSSKNLVINPSGGNVGIGTTSPTGRLMLYQSSAGNVLQNIVSNQGGSTQVGINLSPSMTDAEVASNPAQASIYATDSNYGANIIFATKATGAVGNALTPRLTIASTGDATFTGDVAISKTSTYSQLQLIDNTASGSTWIALSGFPALGDFTIREAGVANHLVIKKTTGAATFSGSLTMTAGYNYVGTNRFVASNSTINYLFAGSASITIINQADNATLATISGTTGVYTPLSDSTKKKDFELSTIGLNEVLKLKPTLYRMKSEDNLTDKHLGFIAQEVKEFIPQAFVESGEGKDKFIGLDYQAITSALVKSVQELSAQIKELQTEIQTLKNK